MTSKRLRSAIHSTAHHAVSGLCYVHPHLGELCKDAGINTATIDLLSGRVAVLNIEIATPLEFASQALSEKFEEILSLEKIERSSLQSARIEFQFRGSRWPRSCYIRVVTAEGREFQDAVGMDGHRAEIVG